MAKRAIYCLNCNTKTRRIYRRKWMKLIPGSKRFYCKKCDVWFLMIGHRVLMKRKRSGNNKL